MKQFISPKMVLTMKQFVFNSMIVTSIYTKLCYGYKKINDDYNNNKWKLIIDICNCFGKVYKFYKIIIYLIHLTCIVLNLLGFPLNSG